MDQGLDVLVEDLLFAVGQFLDRIEDELQLIVG